MTSEIEIKDILQRIVAAAMPAEVEQSKIHPITEENVTEPMAFIDGGSAMLFSSPSVSLGWIRAAQVTYNGLQRTASSVQECFVLFMHDSIAECYPPLLPRLQASGIDLVRKLLERKALVETLPSLTNGFAVCDGDLEIHEDIEADYLARAIALAAKHKATLCGLSKSSTLLMGGVTPLSMSIPGCWHYYPLTEGKSAGVVKLHENSRYVFRIDTLGPNVQRLLSGLRNHSRDISMLGYPYGLYEADRIARISNAERDYLATKLRLTEPMLEKLEKPLNFHSVLDSVTFK